MVDNLMNNSPTGSIGECTSNGWTDSDCFLKWLKYLDYTINCEAMSRREAYPHT